MDEQHWYSVLVQCLFITCVWLVRSPQGKPSIHAMDVGKKRIDLGIIAGSLVRVPH